MDRATLSFLNYLIANPRPSLLGRLSGRRPFGVGDDERDSSGADEAWAHASGDIARAPSRGVKSPFLEGDVAPHERAPLSDGLVQRITRPLDDVHQPRRALTPEDLLGGFEPGTRPTAMQPRTRPWGRSPLAEGGAASRLPLRTLEYDPDRDAPAYRTQELRNGESPRYAQLSYSDPSGGSSVGMVPGGFTPPPSDQLKPEPPKPALNPPLPPSGKTFKPTLGRPIPTPLPGPLTSGNDGEPMRTYRAGNGAFSIPAGDGEGDLIAGLNYVNNLRDRKGVPVVSAGRFVTAVDGNGVNVLDGAGRYVMQDGVPKFYSWEYLRAVGRMANRQPEKKAPPKSQTGVHFEWSKETEKANLEPDWVTAQDWWRNGDGSDRVVDPVAWRVDDDSQRLADKAQRAADGERGFHPTLRNAIQRAEQTGEPQQIDILLPVEPPPEGFTARAWVMGQYGIRVRGVVIVKDGRYYIDGTGTIEDPGQFNYGLDGWDQRGTLGKAFLIGARLLPDATQWLRADFGHRISSPGRDFSIRANRDARLTIWGTVR